MFIIKLHQPNKARRAEIIARLQREFAKLLLSARGQKTFHVAFDDDATKWAAWAMTDAEFDEVDVIGWEE